MRRWFATRRLLRQAGYGMVQGKLLGAFAYRVRGTWILLRPVAPEDFLGEAMHPFMPWRQAKDRMGDMGAEAASAKDATDPDKQGALAERIRAAYRPLLAKAILWPRVSRERTDGAIHVDDLLEDLAMASGLVEAVASATLGRVPESVRYIMEAKSVEVDAIAHRYGKYPHEVVRLGYGDYALDRTVLAAANAAERRAIEEARKNAERRAKR